MNIYFREKGYINIIVYFEDRVPCHIVEFFNKKLQNVQFCILSVAYIHRWRHQLAVFIFKNVFC